MTSDNRRSLGDTQAFARQLLEIAATIDFKVSARGWAYLLEGIPGSGVTKADFDRVEAMVLRCIKAGDLPVDFVAEDDARAFSGVEVPEARTPEEYLAAFLRQDLRAADTYGVDWWEGEKYYIQMIVEKIDLRSLFEPVCERFHIPIATAKGWASVRQRAEYARRFAEAEDNGLRCILLYCGDHDPDGLRISDFLRQNLEDLTNVIWEDGQRGYDPVALGIKRFGLNYDFIEANGYPWIEDLITGSGRNLADPRHKNYQLSYVQEYLRQFGARKCEANALVRTPEAARRLCEDAILRFLGPDAEERFAEKRQAVRDQLTALDERTGYRAAIQAVLNVVEGEAR